MSHLLPPRNGKVTASGFALYETLIGLGVTGAMALMFLFQFGHPQSGQEPEPPTTAKPVSPPDGKPPIRRPIDDLKEPPIRRG